MLNINAGGVPISRLQTIDKQARLVANAVRELLHRPRELPRNLSLIVQYVWNVQLRRKRLLVLERWGGLGDLICALASVPGLQDRHPNSWLVVISPPGCWQLAESSGLPDASVDAKGFLLHGFFGKFVERMCFPSRFYLPFLPDEHNPPRPQRLHLAEEFAQALGVSPSPLAVRIRAPKPARRRVARRLREINPRQCPIIVLHPGPSWPVREWPAPRWEELAELIFASMSAVMIRIGTDRDSMGRLRPGSPIPHAVDWTGKLDVSETVALIEQASAFVGIDSGPLHIAAVLGVPSVALFGAVSGELRLHPRARAAVVTGNVGCLGCHHAPQGPLHWRTGCPHDIACMQAITAEMVFERLRQCLADGSSAASVQPR